MKNFAGLLISVFLLPILVGGALPHPFHVGVTELVWKPETKRLEIMVRLFTDDLEDALRKNYRIEAGFDTPRQLSDINSYLDKYLQKKLFIKVNGKSYPFQVIGSEAETDARWMYAEIKNVPMPKTISVRNTLLFELFDDQAHFIHIKAGKDFKTGGRLSRSEPEKEWKRE